mmetsp:Transcript_9637/g.14358  ORF Transcript_9637/g.14358 Transcript_9637/m.14358 type:complete len:539 (+) Transcript_9637:330-1946(+)
MDALGEGTFGQVVKCRKKDGSLCAAKVIKNKPAYFIQGLIEVKILSKLNSTLDPQDKFHIVRMIDYFVFRNHLVIIFELLSLNIFELIKRNGMQGFSIPLIRSFTKQILEALCVLEEGNIIHCDMKPENVLLASDSPQIKVIDFGSACFENATIYTYIQSRYYRSPEVLIGLPYGQEIDSWSLGCICAELFIGIPLFPGANEYEQVYRIVQLLGQPPDSLVEQGKIRDKFFVKDTNWRMKTREEYERDQKVTLQPYRAYTNLTCLEDLIYLDRRVPNEEFDTENRAIFVDFLKGLLQIDPNKRWSAKQAIQHPFVQGGNLPFNPTPKQHKTKSVPSGALRGSCPSLLERIRGSQDLSAKAESICYKPAIEELNDDFFRGFAHGRLVQMSQPPMAFQNPFMGMPLMPQAMPQPDITGPRYQRPHSYTGPDRPSSPRIDHPKNKKSKKRKNKSGHSYFEKNQRKPRSSSFNEEHQPKLGKNPIEETKRPRSKDQLIKHQPFDPNNIPPITSSSTPRNPTNPPLPNQSYLDKVKREASNKQ